MEASPLLPSTNHRYLFHQLITTCRSCSHAGICNVLLSLAPLRRPLLAIIGGLHLVPTATQPAKETVDFITRRLHPQPKFVLPLHCTGSEPKAWLSRRLGERYIAGGTGMKGVFAFEDGEEEDEEIEWRVDA